MYTRKNTLSAAGLVAVISALILGATWAQDHASPNSDSPRAAFSEVPGSKPGARTGIRCVLRPEPDTTASTRPAILVTYIDDGITWAGDKYDGTWYVSGKAAKGGGLKLTWSGNWQERYALLFSIQRFGSGACKGEHFKY